FIVVNSSAFAFPCSPSALPLRRGAAGRRPPPTPAAPATAAPGRARGRAGAPPRAEADLRRTEQRWPEVRRLAKGLDKGLERNHIVETLLISIQRETPR
uniref:DUF7620 family protein n=1 Tax=Nocardia abscessus TaxID=120957 RepID=UPI002453FAC6